MESKESTKDFFSIGELSKYQNISKQTLIYYDRINLFKPAYTNPDNGYRYYSAAQIDYLDTILIMKKIGFSLDEIRNHMKDSNIDSSLILLRKQLSVIDSRIKELELIKSRLLHRCAQMENAKMHSAVQNPIRIEDMESKYILFHRVSPPFTLKEISIATKKCFSQAFQMKIPIFFQSGVTVPLKNIINGSYTAASTAFLITEAYSGAENIRKLSAGRCVSIYHFGDYESIGRSYLKIMDYCQRNNLEIISDSYEFCINDYITSSDENEYITKIMFYIK